MYEEWDRIMARIQWHVGYHTPLDKEERIARDFSNEMGEAFPCRLRTVDSNK